MQTGLSPTAVADLVSELLAAAPTTVLADREIAAAAGYSGRRDTLDGFGLSGRNYAQLSPEAQAECALSWQWCRNARHMIESGVIKGPPKRRVQAELRARDRHLECLLGSVFRLARQVSRDRLASRYASDIPDDVLKDVLAAAAELAIEMAGTFDPSKGPSFATWYAARLRTRVGSIASALTTSGKTTDSWIQAAKMLRELEPALTCELGRAPTNAEIDAAFHQACLDLAKRKGARTDQEVRAHLVKQGLAAASQDLDAIRSRMGGELSLDVAVGDGDDSFASHLGAEDAAFDLVLEHMGGQIRSLTLRSLSRFGADQVEQLLPALQSGETVSDSVVLRSLRNELCAPHAQWCGLALDPDEVAVVTPASSRR